MTGCRHNAKLPSVWAAFLLVMGWAAIGVVAAPDIPARVAVLELEGAADISLAEASYLTDRVRTALAATLGDQEFLVMTRESIAELLPPDVSLADCVDAGCEVEIGRTLGADCVVSGEVVAFAGEYRLILKAHDCHTAAFLTSETVGATDLVGLESQVDDVAGPVAARLRRSVRASRRDQAPTGQGGGPGAGPVQEPWHLTAGPTTIVRFESRPAGATVTVDGHLVCPSTPCSRELATGVATITMEKPRYGLRQDLVNITDDEGVMVIAWDLTPDFGWLDVTTDPPGLAVEVDGRRYRPAPGDSLVVEPGYHEVRVNDPRYHPVSETVQVGRGGRYELCLVPEPRTGSLRVSALDPDSNAVAAELWLDGTAAGRTPTLQTTVIGRHEAELRGEAGRWYGTVEIAEGDTVLVLATISPHGGPAGANSLGMAMVRLDAGEFLMGSPPYERGRDRDEDRHQVRLTQPFLLAATETTQRQWQDLMGMNPSAYAGDDLPVESVDWFAAVRFCNSLSSHEGLTPAYEIQGADQVRWLPDADGYRLPTEAEWEYACRAGTTTRWASGDHAGDLDRIAWHGGVSGGAPRPVSQLEPNAWGLYDMHGNVWEWCWNWSATYPSRFVTDPTGPRGGKSRVIRGGAWDTGALSCRSAEHNAAKPGLRGGMIGFRVARNAADGVR